MSSALYDIPLEFLNPARKYAFMNYLVGLGLPSRISRGILQQWGEALNVDLSAGDYALLENRLRTVATSK